MGAAAPVVVASVGLVGSVGSGPSVGSVTGGTETSPPPGHQGCAVGHFGPPPGTPFPDGATTSLPGSDSSLPLKPDTAKAKFQAPGNR